MALAACGQRAPLRPTSTSTSAPAPVVDEAFTPVPEGMFSEAAPAVVRPRSIAQRVIIVSEDGMRPDALRVASTPTHTRLMREGASTMRARTIRQASTLPAHAAMLSGFDVVEHGLSWNSWHPERGFIRVPTVFTAVAGAGGQGSAAFVGKKKLEHIVQPGSVQVFERPGYFCRKVVEQAAAYFVEKRPQIEFVHFSDPDDRGHRNGWMSREMIAAVAESDRCLGSLIDAIVNAGLEDETLVIVSADHGGHGRNHSGYGHEEDRLIPWIAWGAGVRPGHKIKGTVNTFDTAATALWVLGHEPPQGLLGRPVAEAFVASDR
jgi:arylsulfatase A-like enzyme